MDIEKFNPTVAELNALVAESQKIKSVDINNEVEMKGVTKARIGCTRCLISGSPS